jgi:hypothetical protein
MIAFLQNQVCPGNEGFPGAERGLRTTANKPLDFVAIKDQSAAKNWLPDHYSLPASL